MIKLYTIECPACNVLMKKLMMKDIPFVKITDPKAFEDLNIEVFPMLQIDDGPLMSYSEALKWLKTLGG